jgi:hypothetical protein
MSECKKAAREYVLRGWSVIPCRGKIPIGEWKEFQKRLPLMKEIDAWPEDANVGIVTGQLSGLGVIDIDSDEGFSGLKKIISPDFTAPMVKTPRGGMHLYCKHTPAIGNKVSAGVEGVDFRGEGGFVVAPPSRSTDGKPYEWDKDFGLRARLPEVPEEYIKLVVKASGIASEKTWVADGKMFSEGRRNNDLFHFALRLARGKTSPEEAFNVLKWVADKCGYPERELRIAIQSAFERAGREERNLSADIGNFITVTDGAFQVKDVAQALNIVTNQDKGTLRVVLHRLKKDGIIQKSGKRDGEYVRANNEVEHIDWENAPTEPCLVKLPLFINDFSTLYPGNLITIAGGGNLGKTAFAMNIAVSNVRTWPVRYISSEMDRCELHTRIKKWEGVPIEDFKKIEFLALGGDSNLGGLIDPNALNIVDYLEEKDGEFFKMGHWVRQIYDALRGKPGIAVVCMQKETGKEYARGGGQTLDKPRLYLSLDIENGRSVCKIVKCKNPKGATDPNRKQMYYKIIGGWKILPDGQWGYPNLGGKR